MDFGTLLGIIRENDIILGDTDVDICILDTKSNHEKMKLVKNDIEKLGFKVTKETWSAYRVRKSILFADIILINLITKINLLGAVGNNQNVLI